MTKQVKEQIKAAAIIFVVIIAGVLVQGLYIRMKQAEDAVKGYERRSDKANHTIDSLSGLNAERMAQIEVLREQLEFNKQQYEANISAIDSLDRNGLRRAMHNLLASLTLVSLTTSEVRALLKLKAERDYLFKQVSVLTRNDSISQMIMRDQNKSIDEWKMIVVERDRTIEELKGDIETQTNRKKFWRTTTLVGLPSALIGGILIVLL